MRPLIGTLQNIPVRHITPVIEPSLLGDFSVRKLQDVLGGTAMAQPLHRHDFYYLLAIEKGSGDHSIDFNPYKVKDHSLFLMRPGQVHQLNLDQHSTGYLMQFNTEFYAPADKASLLLLRRASSQNGYSLDSFEKISSALENIFQEFKEKKEGYNIVVKSAMDMLLIELVRSQGEDEKTTKHLHAQEKFDQFCQLLEQHVLRHKQVPHYAGLMNLSVYQLGSITKAAVGKTPSELIDQQVILEAKRCILATSNQIAQTAYRLGYEDVSYFIRFFKKHTGQSPDSFRKNFS